MKHQATTTLAPEGLPAGLEAVLSLAVTALNEQTNAADLGAVCGFAWQCERAVPAEHNHHVAAL